MAGWPALALLLAVSILERRASHTLAGSRTAAETATAAVAAGAVPVPAVAVERGNPTAAGSGSAPGNRQRGPSGGCRTSVAHQVRAEPATRSLHSMGAIERKARQLADDHQRDHGRPITLTGLQTGLQDAGMGRSRTEDGRLRRIVLGLEAVSA